MERNRDKQQKSRAYFQLGYAYESKKQFQRAIEYFVLASKIAKEQEDKEQETVALLALGYAYKSKNQFQTTIEYFEKALKIAKEQEYKEQETTALLALGYAYKSKNQFQTAVEYFEKALKIAKEQEDTKQETEALLAFGYIYISKNQFRTPIEYFEKALKIAKEQEDTKQETEALLAFGYAYKSNYQFEKAIQYCQKALKIGDRHQEKRARNAIEELTLIIDLDTHEDSNENLKTSSTSDVAQLRNSQDENVDNVDHIDIKNESISEETRILAEQLLTGTNTSDGVENVAVIREQVPLAVSAESWKWEETSTVHREKFIKLLEYSKTHLEEIKEVNGVYVCCSKDFLIGMGGNGTRVYVGLGKDGYGRAVKRLPRDACTGLAEQEKRILNQFNATKSNYVVNYWFLDEQTDKDYLFLILDLCEETLENFVAHSSIDDLLTIAPDIIHQVLKGLADLHCDPMPILHRDLKPSNIFRNVHNKWLLADFGISRILTGVASTHPSNQRGTEDWRAVESSYPSNGMTDDGKVRYKKESDIQVAGIVAYYIVTKGEHPFGAQRHRLGNLLDGKPVALETLKDPILKDLLSWMLSHDPKDRPSAEKALKHPYLQSKKQQFEMLCRMGNQPEIKTGDFKSDVVRKLNSDPKDWRSLMSADVLKYLSTDSSTGKTFHYKPSCTDCLRLIRNVKEHWHDRSRPRPEVFYVVGDPQQYFLNLFSNLPAEVHRIVRSCDWKDRPDLKEYFI